MQVKYVVKKNTYYDSVTLMLITKEIKKIPQIREVLIGMGTELNKELAKNLGILTDEIECAGVNDFFVTLLAEKELDIKTILDEIHKLLSQKKKDNNDDYMPPTQNSALKHQPESNIAIISVAGNYAAEEARKALNNDLHVMLFSDNVSVEEEKELKELAREKGLLMMGPDCGTAIINNVPLAFANVVKKGSIGVIGASGTGTQEVTVLIDKLGEGVSQVIGTGGRDLKKEIGGIMMLQGIDALINDVETKVIVLISKPPAEEVAEKILKAVANSPKPVVVNFIGGDRGLIEKYGAVTGTTLEDTAHKAVALLRGGSITDFNDFDIEKEAMEKIIEGEVSRFHSSQKYVRGLFTGGTLADEAMKLLSKDIGNIYSNIPFKPEYKLDNTMKSIENACIDLGDDQFTIGRPHPMIDPSTRVDRLQKEVTDDEVAVVLMDFVLGYGSHEDPVGEMLPSINEAKRYMEERGKYLSIVASVCGTEKDPQGLMESQKRLQEAGVIVMPSNAQAVRITGMILNRINNRWEVTPNV